MYVHEDFAKYDFQKLIRSLEEWIDFKHWGFKFTYSSPTLASPMYFVFQSDQCKLRFTLRQDRPYETPWISDRYGRMHAPPGEDFMIWKGRKCLCWHSIGRAISFFDGVSPVESEQNVTPTIIRDFYQANIKRFEQSEYVAKLTVQIWEHYGQRIFNLYDIRQADLWNQYVDFIRECEKVSEEKTRSQGRTWLDSELYKVC